MKGPSGCSAAPLEHLVDQEQIGEQRANMDVRVEVVDDLRVNRGVRLDHPNGRLGVRGVTLDDADEGTERHCVETGAADLRDQQLAEAAQRVVELLEVIANLDGLGGEALRRVPQEELCTLPRSRRCARPGSRRTG